MLLANTTHITKKKESRKPQILTKSKVIKSLKLRKFIPNSSHSRPMVKSTRLKLRLNYNFMTYFDRLHFLRTAGGIGIA